MDKKLEIDVFSDPVCPWCFIGKRRLEAALQARPEIRAKVRWRTFQLNPDMPSGGMPRSIYLNTKFGGLENAQRIYSNIAAAGRSVGIDFRFDLIQTTPNTQAAHRLVKYFQATAPDTVTAFVTRLFEAYFFEGRDIGNWTTLETLAAEAGLDAFGARPFLESEDLKCETLEEDAMGRRMGINGVPCFIINQQYALAGAQEPEAFMPLFDLAVTEAKDSELQSS